MFHPGAYWKELEQTGPDIDKSIMDLDGVSFRVPRTTAKEHDAVFSDYPKKRNYEETFD